tara:strand:+ start:771 stop:953 length:183 start_codon:yes stop_codon:yes gene_type:complete
MIYKAKPSYKKLKDSENYNHLGSPVKHYKLLNDEEINVTDLPKELEKHLIKVETKKKGDK